MACLLGLAAAGCDKPSPAPVQANGAGGTASPDEVADDGAPTGPIASGLIDKSHRGEPAPAVGFQNPDGTAVTLAAFKGRPVLVNLWATWCAPCIAEMPTLDAAAKRLGDGTAVLAVSQDLDPAKAAPFLKNKGVSLAAYRDPEMGLSLAYKVSLPFTILFGPDGRERWRVSGGRDWASAESLQLIAEAS